MVGDIYKMLEGSGEDCRVTDMLDYNKDQIKAAADSALFKWAVDNLKSAWDAASVVVAWVLR